MLNYLLHRLATIVPTLFFVSVLIFGLQQLLPGDPAMILAGEERDVASLAGAAVAVLALALPASLWHSLTISSQWLAIGAAAPTPSHVTPSTARSSPC